MTPRKAPRAKGLLFGLALALTSSALVVGALEAGSYLFGRFEVPWQPLWVGSLEFLGHPDPLLFWSLRPGSGPDDGRRWINRDGLRGPEVGPKRPGELRVLSLGESTTFAAQMRYEQSYSARLERLLDAARDAPVRVLNAGVPGYTLFQGVRFLEHRALRLEPDLVLLYFGYNDFLPVAYLAGRRRDGTPRAGGLNDWELFESRRTPLARVAGFLGLHSNFFRGVLALRREQREEGLRRQPDRPRVPREHRRRLLEDALSFCREHGLDLVVIVPIYRSFDDHVELLRAFAREHDEVALVDLPAVLPARFTAPIDAYFLDAVHPTPEAHGLIAAAIHEVLAPRLR